MCFDMEHVLCTAEPIGSNETRNEQQGAKCTINQLLA
jgi:hypothetical protein